MDSEDISVSLKESTKQFLPSAVISENCPSFNVNIPHLFQVCSLSTSSNLSPIYSNYVPAGFPSPADDYVEASLDLNEHLIKHPAATFFVRVSGDSMKNAGIHDHDILVVDRSLQPKHGDIIIAALNGEFTVKRLHCRGGAVALVPENPDYPAININEDMEFIIWGVVTSVVHKFRGEL